MSTSERHTGPHVVMAVLCEKALQEQDGVISIIRVVDQITQTQTGPDTPEAMTPFVASDLTLVISLKADQARGRYGIKVRPEAPGGFQLPAIEQAIQLQAGGGGGVNLILPLILPVSQEGLYWFDVFLTGPAPQPERLLTRVPLEVVYQPLRLGGAPPEQ